MRPVGADLIAGALDFAQDTQGVFEQFVAGFSEAHATVGAREQAGAQFLFEPLHVPAQRRLGDAQMSGGARDAAEFGDPNKIAKASEFHTGAIAPTGGGVNRFHAGAAWQ
jgi:hypothetical protein